MIVPPWFLLAYFGLEKICLGTISLQHIPEISSRILFCSSCINGVFFSSGKSASETNNECLVVTNMNTLLFCSRRCSDHRTYYLQFISFHFQKELLYRNYHTYSPILRVLIILWKTDSFMHMHLHMCIYNCHTNIYTGRWGHTLEALTHYECFSEGLASLQLPKRVGWCHCHFRLPRIK